MTSAPKLLVAIGVLALASRPVSATMPCDADLDGDGDVGVIDFLDLLAAWGTDPGGPPDFDGGGVGVTDFLALLAEWGPIALDYGPPLPDAEARQIALETAGASGPVFADPALYARIDADLAAIRAFEPDLAGQTHSGAWIASEMIVQLVPGEDESAYLCLNEQYQVTNIDNLFGDWWVLAFAGDLNVPALLTLYMQAPSVAFAEPNGLIGGQNFWVPTASPTGDWQWNVDDGFTDCFDGCDCHRFYIFRTDEEGTVQLVSYQEVGPSYCGFE
jgi:hypothetical protein